MRKLVVLVLVIFAIGGGGMATHWLWTRVVLVFACCALGLFWISPRNKSSDDS